MPKKIFISLPMRGHSIEEIRNRRDTIYELANSVMDVKYELIDTICTDESENPNNKLWYLGRSIQLLGEADLAIFAMGWFQANGCIVERVICDLYGVSRLEEQDLVDLREMIGRTGHQIAF